ncbi:MAG: hypothetical protein AAGJ95_09550 [Cyanobacteria bacterium J06554_11]
MTTTELSITFRADATVQFDGEALLAFAKEYSFDVDDYDNWDDVPEALARELMLDYLQSENVISVWDSDYSGNRPHLSFSLSDDTLKFWSFDPGYDVQILEDAE